MDTEIKLLLWREGQTKAERLSANLLDLDGFTSIDPQCPLGGPDGVKDILCEKNGWKYVGASYFPTTEKEFKDIKTKFKGDLLGVAKNNVDGIIFITNQKLSPTERNELIKEAEEVNSTAMLYHREKIRVLLDSPQGFALRLNVLGIEMSKEEQMSFFSDQRNYLKKLLNDQSEHIITSIGKKLDHWKTPSDKVFSFVQNLYETTQSTMSQFFPPLSKTDKSKLVFPTIEIITGDLDINLLCLLHKAILFETSSTVLGQLRKSNVWIGSPTSNLDDASFVPPAPEEVEFLTDKMLKEWREVYSILQKTDDRNLKLEEITKFHYKFLSIHPFLDGNGRVARFILTQQTAELFNINQQIILEDRAPYLQALTLAQEGEIDPLKLIITQAIFGTDEIIKNEA